MKYVELIASGYEWDCPECDVFNEIIEVPKSRIVYCSYCGKPFSVDNFIHAIEE